MLKTTDPDAALDRLDEILEELRRLNREATRIINRQIDFLAQQDEAYQ